MSYIDLLPDDMFITILETRCNDIEEAIRLLELNVEHCNNIINNVNSDIDTLSYHSLTDDESSYHSLTDEDEDDEDDIELQQQRHDDQVWLDNMNLNMYLDMHI
jgi:hypothetical protein